MPDVAPRANEDSAHDVFDVLLQRDGKVFGAGCGAAVGEGFFVAYRCEAGGNVLLVGEFRGEGGEGEGIMAEKGGCPVKGGGLAGSRWRVD